MLFRLYCHGPGWYLICMLFRLYCHGPGWYLICMLFRLYCHGPGWYGNLNVVDIILTIILILLIWIRDPISTTSINVCIHLTKAKSFTSPFVMIVRTPIKSGSYDMAEKLVKVSVNTNNYNTFVISILKGVPLSRKIISN